MMDHNLFRLPHCPVHHSCCCSGPPFLQNHPGKMCTLHGVRYILATVDFAPSLVPLRSKDARDRVPVWSLEGLVWQEGWLLPEEDIPDGSDLHFDAVLKSTGQGAYQLVLAWLGCKPSQVQVPATGTCHLLKCHQNVLTDFSLAGKLYVKVKIGEEFHQLATPQFVIKDGVWIERSSVNEESLRAMKACVCEILTVQNNGFVRKLVVTALYSGDLPYELENIHLMHSYKEPLEGLPRVAVEYDTIKLDTLFNREQTNSLIKLIFSETELKALCRDWSKIKDSRMHVLLSNKCQSSNLCFFNDLSCCYFRSNPSDGEDNTQAIEINTEVLHQTLNTQLKPDLKTMQGNESEKLVSEKLSSASIFNQPQEDVLLETEETALLSDHEQIQIENELEIEDGSVYEEKENRHESEKGVIDPLFAEATTHLQQSCKAVLVNEPEQVTVAAEAGHMSCGLELRNDIPYPELEMGALSFKSEVKNISGEAESWIVTDTNENTTEISSSKVENELDSFSFESPLHSNELLNHISILEDAEGCVQETIEVTSDLSGVKAMSTGSENFVGTHRAEQKEQRSSDQSIHDVSTDSSRLDAMDRNDDKRDADMIGLEDSGEDTRGDVEGQTEQITTTSTLSSDDYCRAIRNLTQVNTASLEEFKNSEIIQTSDVDLYGSFVHENSKNIEISRSENDISKQRENTETSVLGDITIRKTWDDVFVEGEGTKTPIASERNNSKEQNISCNQVEENQSLDNIGISIGVATIDQFAGCESAAVESDGESRAIRVTGQDEIFGTQKSSNVVASGCERSTTNKSYVESDGLSEVGQTLKKEVPGFWDLRSSIVLENPSNIVEGSFDDSPTAVVEDFEMSKTMFRKPIVSELQHNSKEADVGSIGSSDKSLVIVEDHFSETSTLGTLFADLGERLSVSSEFLSACSEGLTSASEETFESCDSIVESHSMPILLKEYKLLNHVEPCDKQNRFDQSMNNSKALNTSKKSQCCSNIWNRFKAHPKAESSSGTSSEEDEPFYSRKSRVIPVEISEDLYDLEKPDKVARRSWKSPVEGRISRRDFQEYEDLQMDSQVSDVNEEHVRDYDSKRYVPSSVIYDGNVENAVDYPGVCLENKLTKCVGDPYLCNTTKSSDKNASSKIDDSSKCVNKSKNESVVAGTLSSNIYCYPPLEEEFDFAHCADVMCSCEEYLNLHRSKPTSHVSDITRLLAQIMTTVQLAINENRVRYILGPLEPSQEDTTISLPVVKCTFGSSNDQHVCEESALEKNMDCESTNGAAVVVYNSCKAEREVTERLFDQRWAMDDVEMSGVTSQNGITICEIDKQVLNDQELHQKIDHENPSEAPNDCQVSEKIEVERSSKSTKIIDKNKKWKNEIVENGTNPNQEKCDNNIIREPHKRTINDNCVFYSHKPSQGKEQISLKLGATNTTKEEMKVRYVCCTTEADNQLVISSQEKNPVMGNDNRCGNVGTHLQIGPEAVLCKPVQYKDQKRRAMSEMTPPDPPLTSEGGSEERTPGCDFAHGYPDHSSALDIMSDSKQSTGLVRVSCTEDARPESDVFEEDLVGRKPLDAEEEGIGEQHGWKKRLLAGEQSSEKCLTEAKINERSLQELGENTLELPAEDFEQYFDAAETYTLNNDSFPIPSVLKCIQEESDSNTPFQEFEEVEGNVTSAKNILSLSLPHACPTNRGNESSSSTKYEETENGDKSHLLRVEDSVSSYEHEWVQDSDNRFEVSVPECEIMKAPHNIMNDNIDNDSVSDIMELLNNNTKCKENNADKSNQTNDKNDFAAEKPEGSKLKETYQDLEGDEHYAVQESDMPKIVTNSFDSSNEISSDVQSVKNKIKKKTRRRNKKSKTVEPATSIPSEPTTDIEDRSSKNVSDEGDLNDPATTETVYQNCVPYKSFHLFSEENEMDFETFLLSSSSRAKVFRMKRLQEEFNVPKIVPSELRYSWGEVRHCHVQTVRPGKEIGPLTVEPISLVTGNANWLLFKAKEETILLPLITVLSSSHSPSRAMVMFTVSLENNIFVAGRSVARLAFVAFDGTVPVQYLRDHFATRLPTYGKLNQSQIDSLIGPNPAGLNLKCQNGMRVVGVLTTYTPAQESFERAGHFFSVKFQTEPQGMWFYSKLSRSLCLRLLNNNTFSHCELQCLPVNINTECLACVQLDKSNFSIFPGYEITELIVGKQEDLVRHATTWRRRCTSQLREWIKQDDDKKSAGLLVNKSEAPKRKQRKVRANVQAETNSETKKSSTAERDEERSQDVDHRVLENPRLDLDLDFTSFLNKDNKMLGKKVHEVKKDFNDRGAKGNQKKLGKDDEEEDSSEGEEDAEKDDDEKEKNENSDHEEDGNNGNGQNGAEDDGNGTDHRSEWDKDKRDSEDRDNRSKGNDTNYEKGKGETHEQKYKNCSLRDEFSIAVNEKDKCANCPDGRVVEVLNSSVPHLDDGPQSVMPPDLLEELRSLEMVSCVANSITSTRNKNIGNFDANLENIDQNAAGNTGTYNGLTGSIVNTDLAIENAENTSPSHKNLDSAAKNATSVTGDLLSLSTSACNYDRSQCSELAVLRHIVGEPTEAMRDDRRMYPNIELRHYCCFKKDIRTSHLILGACGHSILLPRDSLLSTRRVETGDGMQEGLALTHADEDFNISKICSFKPNTGIVSCDPTKYNQSPILTDDKSISPSDDPLNEISFSSRTSSPELIKFDNCLSRPKKSLNAWCVPLSQRVVVANHSVDMLAVVGHVGRATATAVQIVERLEHCNGNLVREAARRVCVDFQKRLSEDQLEIQMKLSETKDIRLLLNDQKTGNRLIFKRQIGEGNDNHLMNESTGSVLKGLETNGTNHEHEWSKQSEHVLVVPLSGILDNQVPAKLRGTAANEGTMTFEPLSPAESKWVHDSLSDCPELGETRSLVKTSQLESTTTNDVKNNEEHGSKNNKSVEEHSGASLKSHREEKCNRHCSAKMDDGIRSRDTTKPRRYEGDPYEIASQCIKTAISRLKKRNEPHKDEQGPSEPLHHPTDCAGDNFNNSKPNKGYKMPGKSSTQQPTAAKASVRQPETRSGREGVAPRQQLGGSHRPVALRRRAEMPCNERRGSDSLGVGPGMLGDSHPHGELVRSGPMLGEVVGVKRDGGELKNVGGELRTFSSERCFLYGIELNGFNLSLIFRVGMQLTYTEEDTQRLDTPSTPPSAGGGGPLKDVWVREGECLMGEDLLPAVRGWCGRHLVTGSGKRKLISRVERSWMHQMVPRVDPNDSRKIVEIG